MERAAGERFEAREGGNGRAVELPDRRDQDLRREPLVSRRSQAPETGAGLEASAGDLDAEAHVAQEAVLVGAALHVREDLGLRGPLARPVDVLLEREAVRARGDVARRARIAVVAPGAAEARGLLEDREVVDARPFELHPQAKPGEAEADDRDGLGHAGPVTPEAE